jgi:hypothetical protein
MAAQEIREVPKAAAQALIASGRRVAAQTWAVPSRGVTVTVKPAEREGYVKLVIVKGCDC